MNLDLMDWLTILSVLLGLISVIPVVRAAGIWTRQTWERYRNTNQQLNEQEVSILTQDTNRMLAYVGFLVLYALGVFLFSSAILAFLLFRQQTVITGISSLISAALLGAWASVGILCLRGAFKIQEAGKRLPMPRVESRSEELTTHPTESDQAE